MRRTLGETIGFAVQSLDSWFSLTDRQREVADLIADGRSNAEIASRLGISPRTVERHANDVYEALGIKNEKGNYRVLLAEFRRASGGLTPGATQIPDGLEILGDCVGRTIEESQVLDALSDRQCRVVVVWGMHGVGKSLVARRGLSRWLRERAAVIPETKIINCDSDPEFELLPELEVALDTDVDVESDDPSELAANLASSLASSHSFVLVESLERALERSGSESEDLTRQFDFRSPSVSEFLLRVVQSGGVGKLVITTTHLPSVLAQAAPGRVRYIGRSGARFTGLNEEEGLELLGRYDTGLSAQACGSIVNHFEGHPEALMWAGELLGGRLAQVGELLEGTDLSLQQRIHSLLGRVYRSCSTDELHVLNSLSVLRRAASLGLLDRIFELNPPPGPASWQDATDSLFNKSLAQALSSRSGRLYYLHVLVLDLARAGVGDPAVHHGTSALAYDELMTEAWDKRVEEAERYGLESYYHFNMAADPASARAIGRRIIPALEASGAKYIREGRYEDALEALNEQISLLSDRAASGDHSVHPRLGKACFQRARMRRRHGDVDEQTVQDLDTAVRYAERWEAFQEYSRLLELRGAELLKGGLVPKVRELVKLASAHQEAGVYQNTEVILGQLVRIWFHSAGSEAERLEAYARLSSLFETPPAWGTSSYYIEWANIQVVLGDHQETIEQRRRHYLTAEEAAVKGLSLSSKSIPLAVAESTAKRRLAEMENSPAVCRRRLQEAKSALEARKANSEALSLRSAAIIDDELVRLEIGISGIEPSGEARMQAIDRIRVRLSQSNARGLSATSAVMLTDQLLEAADAAIDLKSKDELLSLCQRILDPLVASGTTDWRIYARFVRVLGRRGEEGSPIPPEYVEQGLKAISNAPDAARNARLLQARGELLRRKLSRLGWKSDVRQVHTIVTDGERTLKQAITADSEDPYNRLQLGQLYSAAAMASASRKDYERYELLAGQQIAELLARPYLPPGILLECAVFFRRTWRYHEGVQVFQRYMDSEPRRARVWRNLYLYLELILGLHRESTGESQAAELAEAVGLGGTAVDAGYRPPRLICAYAGILHLCGRGAEGDRLIVENFTDPANSKTIPDAATGDAAWTGASWRQMMAAIRETIVDPLVANSLGTFLKECHADRSGAIEMYEWGLPFAKGSGQAEAILCTNIGIALADSDEILDLHKAREYLNRGQSLSGGRYPYAKIALDKLNSDPRLLAGTEGADTPIRQRTSTRAR